MWKDLGKYLNSGEIVPEKGILKAKHLTNHCIEIWFEEERDVSIFELDFLPILSEGDAGEAMRPLLDVKRIAQVVGRYNLTWYDPETGDYNEDAIDISPEAVKWFCLKYGKRVK